MSMPKMSTGDSTRSVFQPAASTGTSTAWIKMWPTGHIIAQPPGCRLCFRKPELGGSKAAWLSTIRKLAWNNFTAVSNSASPRVLVRAGMHFQVTCD